MRKELFTVDNYVHIYNRGNRKAEIVRTTADKWRFLQALRFFNDSHSSTNILRKIMETEVEKIPKSLSHLRCDRLNKVESVFEMGWPPNWTEKDPLVKILCYSLLPNHYHLLLKEIREGGISKFMQKLGGGYTNYFNFKHQEVGRVFQGPYKAKLVDEEMYLKYLSVYIQVINVLELFPSGLSAAFKDLKRAMKFVEEYPFSSYADYIGLRRSLIIDKDVLGEIFSKPEDYKNFVYDVISTKDIAGLLGDLKME